MFDQNNLTNALRAYAEVANPDADAMPSGWNSDGLSDARIYEDDAPDAYVPSGNERFDAIVRKANPRFHYGYVAGYTRASEDNGDTWFDYIMFPPMSAFETPHGYVRTLAHELVHWTQRAGTGATREPAGMSAADMFLARLKGEPPEGYVQEELTAEIGATLLLDAVGADVDMPARAHYIANWESAVAPEKRERLFDAATVDAKRAVNWLLSL